VPNTLSSHVVGGAQLFSTVDWPDHITATIFVKGCPWRCPYCHNTHLLSSKPSSDDVSWLTVTEELRKRSSFLDAVVFSGGEPLASPLLVSMMQEVKDMDYLVGLHTNGANPAKLSELLHLKSCLVDWVGLDIKAPLSRYDEITRTKGSGTTVHDSLEVLKGSNTDYELRTTLYPEVFDKEAFLILGEELLALGEKKWVLQKCREVRSVREMMLSFNLEAAKEQLLQRGFKVLTIR